MGLLHLLKWGSLVGSLDKDLGALKNNKKANVLANRVQRGPCLSKGQCLRVQGPHTRAAVPPRSCVSATTCGPGFNRAGERSV